MIGKGRQDSAKFSNWRPKATELGRFVSYLLWDGMDCLSQAEYDALAHGLRRGWPNRRIHAPKAEALLSGSDYGRGFGSVFHHQFQKPELVSGFFTSARRASAGGTSRIRLASVTLPIPAFFCPSRPLCSPFLSVCLASVREVTSGNHAGFGVVGCGWKLVTLRDRRIKSSVASR